MPEQDTLSVGARLRARRRHLGLTQAALAERMRALGWAGDQTGICDYERDRYARGVPSAVLEMVCKALGLTLAEFFGPLPDGGAAAPAADEAA